MVFTAISMEAFLDNTGVPVERHCKAGLEQLAPCGAVRGRVREAGAHAQPAASLPNSPPLQIAAYLGLRGCCSEYTV
ncbi:jg27249 [Pararge aegeria aegeria]|uniref:Jg27249 protein n=1 Tax=Pararge aegeria aegeria TaxID=348720 RepID=A0A8S4RZ33_9NEOP|nr:jg27249 [Pararge aegeria aegeria]